MSRTTARLSVLLFTCALAAYGCGDDGGGNDDGAFDVDAEVTPQIDASPDEPDAEVAGPLTLTSTAFAEGGVIPQVHSCEGTNTSPALAWTGGMEAASYGLVFRDTNNGLIHSVMWDIPGSTTELPENVDKLAEPSVPAGAKQTFAYDGQTRGYLGPCPPSMHVYEFELYVLDVTELGGVGLQSTKEQVAAAIEAAALESDVLSASFTPGQ